MTHPVKIIFYPSKSSASFRHLMSRKMAATPKKVFTMSTVNKLLKSIFGGKPFAFWQETFRVLAGNLSRFGGKEGFIISICIPNAESQNERSGRDRKNRRLQLVSKLKIWSKVAKIAGQIQ